MGDKNIEQVRAYKEGYGKGYNDGLRDTERRMRKLRHENKKLCGIARDMYRELRRNTASYDKFHDRMRKLGLID